MVLTMKCAHPLAFLCFWLGSSHGRRVAEGIVHSIFAKGDDLLYILKEIATLVSGETQP